MKFGDEGEVFDPAPADLAVSLAPRELGVATPAEGTLSSERQSSRREVVATAQSPLATSAAPGSVRTYETPVRAIAPRVAANLGAQVFPMLPEDVFYGVLSAVVPL